MNIRQGIVIVLGSMAATLAAACASAPAGEDMSMGSDAAALWSRTCTHCHNLRAAPEFTAEQWPVIVTHMRTLGDLTRSEAEAVGAYLQSVAERSGDSP